MADSPSRKRPEGGNASPQAKHPRALPPDVTVVVGGVEFECYKIALCFASDYFDTMLSAGMREEETGRIELPGKDPEEWKQFYKIIDPRQIGQVKARSSINEGNAVMLTAWFHEFQMEAHLKECDHVLSYKVEGISHWEDKDKGRLNQLFWRLNCARIRERFRELLNLLQHSCKYDLFRTKGEAEFTIGSLLRNHLCDSYALFDVGSVRELVSLCLPVSSANIRFTSSGACRHLWTRYLSNFLIPHRAHLTADMINSNEMFPLLLHSYMQQRILREKRFYTASSRMILDPGEPEFANPFHRRGFSVGSSESNPDDSNSDKSNSDYSSSNSSGELEGSFEGHSDSD
ncbi:hypothetical protein ACHAW6_016122 [Cyclotella cf. meneghiniana]